MNSTTYCPPIPLIESVRRSGVSLQALMSLPPEMMPLLAFSANGQVPPISLGAAKAPTKGSLAAAGLGFGTVNGPSIVALSLQPTLMERDDTVIPASTNSAKTSPTASPPRKKLSPPTKQTIAPMKRDDTVMAAPPVPLRKKSTSPKPNRRRTSPSASASSSSSSSRKASPPPRISIPSSSYTSFDAPNLMSTGSHFQSDAMALDGSKSIASIQTTVLQPPPLSTQQAAPSAFLQPQPPSMAGLTIQERRQLQHRYRNMAAEQQSRSVDPRKIAPVPTYYRHQSTTAFDLSSKPSVSQAFTLDASFPISDPFQPPPLPRSSTSSAAQQPSPCRSAPPRLASPRATSASPCLSELLHALIPARATIHDLAF